MFGESLSLVKRFSIYVEVIACPQGFLETRIHFYFALILI